MDHGKGNRIALFHILSSLEGGKFGDGHFFMARRLKNSARVVESAWKQPFMLLVTVVDPCFETPRITMHMCLRGEYSGQQHILRTPSEMAQTLKGYANVTESRDIVIPSNSFEQGRKINKELKVQSKQGAK